MALQHLNAQQPRFDKLIYVGLLGFLLVAFVFPFIYMIVISFKSQIDTAVAPHSFIFTPTLANYTTILSDERFVQRFINSIIVGFGSVALSYLIGLPAAYSIARFRQNRLALLVLIIRMIPSVVFLLPLFVLYTSSGLKNTHIGLIISHLIHVLPLMIWLMIGFFEDIPIDLEEQGRVDGCNQWQAFYRIAVPLALPGLVVSGVLGLILSWNDLIFVLILGGQATNTLPMTVFQFLGAEEQNIGGVAAAAAVLTVPVMVVTLLVQKWMSEGLTVGAVK